MNTENKEKQEEQQISEQKQDAQMQQSHEQVQKVKTIVIDLGKIKQTKAFARQDGTILGAVWIVSFAFTMLAANPAYQMLGLIANILTLSTPFVVARRLKVFRDQVRDGHISFRHGFYYCLQTFFYATLLLTIVQYLWFRFMDMGPFMSQLQANYQIVMQAYKLTAQESKAVLDAIAMMKPIAWASMFMITDLVAGAVLSPIIAAVMAKRKLNQQVIR